MNNAKLKEMRNEIKELKESKHDGEFKTGLFIEKVGYKFIHVLNIHGGSRIDKMSIRDFYLDFINVDHYFN